MAAAKASLGDLRTLTHYVLGNLSLGIIQLVHEADQSPQYSVELIMIGAFLRSAVRLHGVHRNNLKIYQAHPTPTWYTVLLLCMKKAFLELVISDRCLCFNIFRF